MSFVYTTIYLRYICTYKFGNYKYEFVRNRKSLIKTSYEN